MIKRQFFLKNIIGLMKKYCIFIFKFNVKNKRI